MLVWVDVYFDWGTKLLDILQIKGPNFLKFQKLD